MADAAARHSASAPPSGRQGFPTIIEGIRQGALEVRIARSAAEIDAAQALRYKVFYEELTARPTPDMQAIRRDFDRFDAYCDHLLVIDHTDGGDGRVVGTYRLL